MDRIYGILLGVGGTALFIFFRWHATRTGEAAGRGAVAYREKNPGIFRAYIMMYTVLAVLCALMAAGYLVGLLPF